MAKSTGNVVNPFFAIDRFEPDVLRYYLARDGGILNDSDYTNEYIVNRYEHQLQRALGNLVSRVTRAKGWNVRQAVEQSAKQVAFSDPYEQLVKSQRHEIFCLPNEVQESFVDLQPRRALIEIMKLIDHTNAFMQQVAPWELAKKLKSEDSISTEEDQYRLNHYVWLAAEALRHAAILLQPFMPNKAAQLADMLGIQEDRRTLAWAQLGKDQSYGASRIELGAGTNGTLFPPLAVRG